MAGSPITTMKLDPEVHRTLKALTRAINRQTDVMIEIEHNRKRDEKSMEYLKPAAAKLEAQLDKESGYPPIDQRIREDAVAEGDDVERLHGIDEEPVIIDKHTEALHAGYASWPIQDLRADFGTPPK